MHRHSAWHFPSDDFCNLPSALPSIKIKQDSSHHLSNGYIMASCKDMNAPVLAESKKVNASLSELYDISDAYSFDLADEEFVEMVQMNAQEHDCGCGRVNLDEHHCCSGLFHFFSLGGGREIVDLLVLPKGCLAGDYRPVDSELEDKVKILGGYDFDVREPFTG